MSTIDRARRERHMDRLFALLVAEVSGFAPAGLLDWEPAAARVHEPERELVRIAGAYERGTVGQEDVLRAARAAQRAWREAAELYARSGFAARKHRP